jgi:hypothetical protein
MDLGLEGGGPEEFFDGLSDDDNMPGVEEAEEANDGKKKKTAAGTKYKPLYLFNCQYSKEEDG